MIETYLQNIHQLKNLLLTSSKKIIITIHHHPDADAIGSALALYHLLKKLKHDVCILSTSTYPSFLSWMYGIDDILIVQEKNPSKANILLINADYIFCLDYSSLHRVNFLENFVKKTNAHKIVVDHHLNPDTFADLYIWNAKASSTTEIIWDIIKNIDLSWMDKNIAECIYAGILTDTGSFKHANTSQNTHRVVAELMQFQINIAKINQLIYDNNSLNKLLFFSFAIQKRLVLIQEKKIAYFQISKKDKAKFHLQIGDTEGLVNQALSIKNITMAAVIKEKEHCVRISLRSVGDIAVNQLASTYFSGGGHKNAAGGTSLLSLEETVKKFETIIHQNY